MSHRTPEQGARELAVSTSRVLGLFRSGKVREPAKLGGRFRVLTDADMKALSDHMAAAGVPHKRFGQS